MRVAVAGLDGRGEARTDIETSSTSLQRSRFSNGISRERGYAREAARLTTSAMIASIAAEGQRTKPAPRRSTRGVNSGLSVFRSRPQDRYDCWRRPKIELLSGGDADLTRVFNRLLLPVM